jgi:hypothetical protein
MNSIQFASLSERGLRAINDDSVCAGKLGAYPVFALADGDILRPGGQVASDIAIRYSYSRSLPADDLCPCPPGEREPLRFVHEGFQSRSVSMRSFRIG